MGADRPFQRVRHLGNVAEFQRRYLLVEVAWEEVVRFYAEWTDRLFDLFPPRLQ